MGDEAILRSIAQKINGSLSLGSASASYSAVDVVGLDMEDERESVFHDAVDKACHILGKLDAFVNCYTYEGTHNFSLPFFLEKKKFDNIIN